MLSKIKRLKIIKKAGNYYAQISIDIPNNESVIKTGKSIGIDVGIKEFYTDSNGDSINNPKYLRKSEKKLKEKQRKVSKKKKGSNNRKKAIKKLSKLHLKISNQRKDFATKLARCVVISNDIVVIEDLKVKNMIKNHKLSKSIADASWSMFRNKLEYYGKKLDKTVVAVDPKYTSQCCSNCGAIVKKDLSVRWHSCDCGCSLDRDHNAAINILNSYKVGRT